MTSYLRRGSGSPLVLVHGIGSRWQCWEPVIDLLAEHHDVIAVDLPGFGETPLDTAVEAGPAGFALWVADLLKELGVSDPHVVGNSMGGGVALEMGRNGVASRVTAFSPIGFWRLPGRIWCQGLVTGVRDLGKVLRPALPQLTAVPAAKAVLVGTMMARPSRVSSESALLQAHGVVDCAGFTGARASFTSYTFDERSQPGALADLPVTIAWGTRDYLLTHRTQSRRAREVFPFARHVDLPGLGHIPFSDDPEVCARVILDEVVV